jgi:hypothetical protein
MSTLTKQPTHSFSPTMNALHNILSQIHLNNDNDGGPTHNDPPLPSNSMQDNMDGPDGAGGTNGSNGGFGGFNIYTSLMSFIPVLQNTFHITGQWALVLHAFCQVRLLSAVRAVSLTNFLFIAHFV